MNRRLPSWATSSKEKARPRRTWPADLVSVAKGWRWGRRRVVPAGAPERSDRPQRRRRRLHRQGSSLWALRERLIVDLSGMDAVAGIEAPVVVASNHQSVLDHSVLLAGLPRSWRCVGGRDWEAALAAGRSVIVFPEGEPSSDGRLGAFSSVAAELAANHNVPLVPVATTGTFNLKSLLSLRFLKERTQVQVRLGSPLAPRLRSISGTTAALHRAVAELLASDEATWWDLQRHPRDDEPPHHIAPWRRMWEQTAPRKRRRSAVRIWGPSRDNRR